MPFFAYRAIDSNGEMSSGVTAGEHIEDARDSVAKSGLYILDISRTSAFRGFLYNKLRGGAVERKDIIEFASNLSVMLNAGLPLLESLNDIADSMDNKRFRTKILDMKNSVELGMSFSEALSRHSDVFPDIFVRLIGAGEETGRIGESMSDIHLHIKRMEDMRKAIVKSLIYPAVALTATMSALLFWLVYVMPRLKDLFATLGTQLPPITRGLIAVSDIAASYWYFIFIIPLLFYLTLKFLAGNPKTRYYLDSVKLKMPIFGQLIYNKLLALFAEQFRILVAGGITIDRSLDIIIDIMDNDVFKKALKKTKDEIVLGSSISEALKNQGQLFPALSIRIISIGESTGRLPEQLDHLARSFIERLDEMSEKIGKMIEPIIIIIIGLMFMMIILGLLSPIFDLISNVG